MTEQAKDGFIAVVIAMVIVFFGFTILNQKTIHGQNVSSTPATLMAGIGTPMANGVACGIGQASTTTASEFIQRDITVGNQIWKCVLASDNVTYAWSPPFNSTPFQNQDFSLQPGLFATAKAYGAVYYELNGVTVQALTTREEGSPLCTAAPVIVLLDLGTSATTAYASATVLYSQTLSTTNTVASNTGLGIAVPAGHYLGIGLSAGACLTPPTISPVVTVQ